MCLGTTRESAVDDVVRNGHTNSFSRRDVLVLVYPSLLFSKPDLFIYFFGRFSRWCLGLFIYFIGVSLLWELPRWLKW